MSTRSLKDVVGVAAAGRSLEKGSAAFDIDAVHSGHPNAGADPKSPAFLPILSTGEWVVLVFQ